MMKRLVEKIRATLWMRVGLFVFIGGIAGFVYYYYVGCYSGTCPITANPYISTSYGALMGLLLSYDRRKKGDKQNV